MPGARPPVDVEVLAEEGGDGHPRPVVHEALRGQLPHRRVDQRVAGASLLPGLERPPRARPAVAARPVVAAGQGGNGGEHLVVEVAPAELAHEGRAAPALARLAHQLQRREAAEAQVGAEPRGRVAGEVVVALVVCGQPVAEEGAHQPPPLALAALRPPRRGRAAGELAERRQPAGADPARHGELARRRRPLAQRQPAPGPVVGTEDLEVVAAARGHRARRHDRHPGVGVEGDPLLLAGARQTPLARGGVGAVVGADVQLGRRRPRARRGPPPRPGRRGARTGARRRAAASRRGRAVPRA